MYTANEHGDQCSGGYGDISGALHPKFFKCNGRLADVGYPTTFN